jgi:hypothetical protein
VLFNYTWNDFFCAIFHLPAHDVPEDMVLIYLPFLILSLINFVFPDRMAKSIVQKDKSVLNKSQDVSQSNAKYLAYGMAQLHNIY